MIIRHNLPTNNFTRIDRRVFTNPDIGHGACRLYGYLCGLRNGANYTDKYLLKALDIRQSSLTKWKKELKDAGLVLVDQVGPNIYVIYIGFTTMPAYEVKRLWEMDEDRE